MSRPPGPTEERQYEIEHLWPRHREILRLSVMGMSNIDISEQLGVSPTTVSNTINSTLGQQIIYELSLGRDESATNISKQIKDVLPSAMKLLRNAVNGYTEEIDGRLTPVSADNRIKAANSVLDRGGYGKINIIRGVIGNVTLTKGDLEELKRRAVESGVENGVVMIANNVSQHNVNQHNEVVGASAVVGSNSVVGASAIENGVMLASPIEPVEPLVQKEVEK